MRERPASRAIMRRFSSPVWASSKAAYCPVRLIVRRTRLRSATTSYPAMRAVPLSAVVSVARMRTAVVLPAPFGPGRAKTGERSARRSMPSGTGCAGLPYDLVSARASIMAGDGMDSPLVRMAYALLCKSYA